MKAYGMDLTFRPSVLEVVLSEKVFREYVNTHIQETQFPVDSPLHRSMDSIIKNGLVKVWEAGRRYQADMEKEHGA